MTDQPSKPKGLNLALNLDLVTKNKNEDEVAQIKEKMYDSYNANSSMRGTTQPMKPKFNLDMGKVTGMAPPQEDTEEIITTAPVEPKDQPASTVNRSHHRNIAQLADQISEMSQSPLHTGKMSNRFRARIGAGGIPTPLGSDMSRAKFDFTGYDPNAMRKKQTSPPRKVITKVEEDMEIFTSDI